MNVIHSVVRPFRMLWLAAALAAFSGACSSPKAVAPPVPEAHFESRPYEFVMVVSAEGLTKDQLYNAAADWFGETFAAAKNIIEVQDREAGRIIAKPSFRYEPTVFESVARIRGIVHYSVKVEVKDGRFRYTIGDFVHEGSQVEKQMPLSFQLLTTDVECPYSFNPADISPLARQQTWDHLKRVARNEAALLVSSLKLRMANAGTNKDNW